MKYAYKWLAILDFEMKSGKCNAAYQHIVHANDCCFGVFVSMEITESMYMQNK